MKIYWNNNAMEELMTSSKISKIEQDVIMRKLNEIESAFFHEFGFQGKFKVEQRTTSGTISLNNRLHAGRTSWRIVADDKRTGAALKSQSGWLSRFTQ